MGGLLMPLRQRFDDLVASLSHRDRRLLMVMTFVWYLAMVALVWWFASGRVEAARAEVSEREQVVKNLGVSASAYAENADAVARIERALKENGGKDLSVFLEQAAQQAGITESLQVRPKEERPEGELLEKLYGVEMSKITLQNLSDFLYAVETGGYPLKIRNLKTKVVTAAGVKVLNVTLEIAVYRYPESEGDTP